MRIVSGIQPTGNQYHIGNYLGAIKNWIDLQNEHDCFFFIADLHAITIPQDPDKFQDDILEKVIELLALGIDPKRCTLFIQSHIPYHTELTWIFNTITPIGELERMTQYKDKSKKYSESINMGLIDYPVLMAADILMYKPDAVPVGEDQKQHIELTRGIAKRFNTRFGKTFPEPKGIIPKAGARIKSLQEPDKKMSKSDNTQSYIGIFDSPEEIEKKIMRSTTDTGKEIKYDTAKKPGISNLLTIYSLFSGKDTKEIEKEFMGKGYGDFKKSLASLLISSLEPFRKKREDLLKKEGYVRSILEQGANKAKIIAQKTTQEVKEKMGLIF